MAYGRVMPRQPRLDAPGALHHVMIRGIERSNIFRDNKDRGQFLSRVGEMGTTTGTRIVAWPSWIITYICFCLVDHLDFLGLCVDC